jgi:TonB family protein
MTIEKEKIGGIIGTIVFSVLLLIILLFSYFTIALPPEEWEGIPVMFGTEDEAGGSTEPFMTETPDVSTSSIPDETSESSLITQSDEPSINVKAQREEEQRKAELDKQRRLQEEAARRQREEEARRREINRQMSGLFGENASGSRGNTEGSGTQGVSTGNATQGASKGSGGIGTYDLSGRSLGAGGLVQPQYTVNDYGTVVVNIIVDPAGNVIHAEIGRGTNTPSPKLREEALRAARSTKFDAINSGNNQQGTITYKFNLN